MPKTMRRSGLLPAVAAALGAVLMMFARGPAHAADAPPVPAASDPAALGWMVGAPPPPEKTIRWADGSFYKFPQLRWSFAHWNELIPANEVWRGDGPVFNFPRAEQPALDALTFTTLGATPRTMNWAEMLNSQYTDAVLVLHKGAIVYERYFGVMKPQTRHIAMSVTKSVFGTLAQMLVAEGKLDPAAPITQYIPELASSGYAGVTVRQLLDMQTGIKYSENYADPNAEIWSYVRAGGITPRPPGYDGPKTFYDFAATVKKEQEPGKAFAYQTVNADVVGWLIRRATGRNIGELLSERIWSKLGVERDAMISVDSAGNDWAGGGMQMTLRDMARFGEMMRLGGRFNGQQIVPRAAVDEIRKGASPEAFSRAGYALLKGWSYHSMWWVSHDDHGVYSARGVHGQTIYIDPKAEMVLVRFASAPQAGNANFDPVVLPAYRAIADALMAR